MPGSRGGHAGALRLLQTLLRLLPLSLFTMAIRSSMGGHANLSGWRAARELLGAWRSARLQSPDSSPCAVALPRVEMGPKVFGRLEGRGKSVGRAPAAPAVRCNGEGGFASGRGERGAQGREARGAKIGVLSQRVAGWVGFGSLPGSGWERASTA